MDNLVEVRHLTKDFKGKNYSWYNKMLVRAVDDESLTITRGEVLGLVGESGCGKSTLGRLILKLIPPTSGQIFYNGEDITNLTTAEMKKKRKSMQIIFQDPYASLNPRMTIGELIKAPLDVHNLGSDAEKEAKVNQLMEEVGLDLTTKSRYPHEFSGGQLQRVVIARALISEPEFVVCDEPVSALDASVRAQVLNLLSRLQKDKELTMLFISHDLSVVKHLSDRVAVMYLGKIVELASVKKLFDTPLHPYTQILISSVPTLDEDRNQERQMLEGEVPSPYDIPQGCRFHPRCPMVMDICRVKAPTLEKHSEEHSVSCHLY